ncbi:hypothetical protein [Gordonia crocea]|uniref:Uncharacterized protein n=1 Tax=Gordonia crocea TaxID=589162 RepID=A0A7I9UVT0_9ACTN|nr:hypothetical protein [Gordonia crocea]GED96880.1 hypothetical protein nbrc107697_09190 [Gordonia crocea]
MSAPHPGLPALRTGVAVAVPALALTAHATATGMMPQAAAFAACLGLGGLLALVVGGPSGGISMPRTLAVLTVGQAAGHLAAGIGDGASGHAYDSGPMLAWHLVAVPASAVLLVLVARCYALVTAVIAVLTSLPAAPIAAELHIGAVVARPATAVVGAGASPRAPPLFG